MSDAGPPQGWPYMPVLDTSVAGGTTISFALRTCPKHTRQGCAHTWTCPNCGGGQTTVPDPCERK